MLILAFLLFYHGVLEFFDFPAVFPPADFIPHFKIATSVPVHESEVYR